MSQNLGLPMLDKKPATQANKASRNTSRRKSNGRLTPQQPERSSPETRGAFHSAKTADIPEKLGDLAVVDISTTATQETPTNSSLTGKLGSKFVPSKGWSKREAFGSSQQDYGDDEPRNAVRTQPSNTGRSLPRLGARVGGSSSTAITSQKRDSSRPEGKEKERPSAVKHTPINAAKVLLSGFRGKEQQAAEEADKKRQKAKPQAVVESLSNMVLAGLCAKTQAGFSEGKTKTNQDAIFYSCNLKSSPNCALFGVFDGHGLQGHKVSAYIKANLKSSRYD